jgi:hypothetical protein
VGMQLARLDDYQVADSVKAAIAVALPQGL